ncbi:MAG TPA: twin-arginine translocase subunit TatC [Planctomycetes bacterium]|nr:twin-arginine translocase subunit TatC [Planctomycetota bacterium]|tara:strand:+ start:2151 stop:2936 length:786 start_codon:yes stop_codon:yes gene_type:complete
MGAFPNHPDEVRMTFSEHLDELRKRFGYSLLFLGILFFVGWTLFSSQLESIFLRPHREAVAALAASDPPVVLESRLAVLAPVEHIFFDMKIAFLAALAFGLPALLWQIWSFIATGLFPKERRVVLSILPFSLISGAAGIGFGYFVLIPTVLQFLYGMVDTNLMVHAYRLADYFSMFFLLTVALAIIFQLPLLMVGLHAAGLVQQKMLRHYRRHFILGAFVLSALLTPPEPLSQVLMALPTAILYELGLLLVTLRERRAQQA